MKKQGTSPSSLVQSRIAQILINIQILMGKRSVKNEMFEPWHVHISGVYGLGAGIMQESTRNFHVSSYNLSYHANRDTIVFLNESQGSCCFIILKGENVFSHCGWRMGKACICVCSVKLHSYTVLITWEWNMHENCICRIQRWPWAHPLYSSKLSWSLRDITLRGKQTGVSFARATWKVVHPLLFRRQDFINSDQKQSKVRSWALETPSSPPFLLS